LKITKDETDEKRVADCKLRPPINVKYATTRKAQSKHNEIWLPQSVNFELPDSMTASQSDVHQILSMHHSTSKSQVCDSEKGPHPPEKIKLRLE